MEQSAASSSYRESRVRLEEYFDKTARKAWEDLTSDVPVSGIRATVRAGRDEMRSLLLSTLPADMHGMRLLDAGCGTGALAIEAAHRGADVVAIDVSQGLIEVAAKRTPDSLSIDWRIGDMFDPALGQFDHVIAMDSLIHYDADDVVAVVSAGPSAPSTSRSPLLRVRRCYARCTLRVSCSRVATARQRSSQLPSGICPRPSRQHCPSGRSISRSAFPAAFTNRKRWGSAASDRPAIIRDVLAGRGYTVSAIRGCGQRCLAPVPHSAPRAVSSQRRDCSGPA